MPVLSFFFNCLLQLSLSSAAPISLRPRDQEESVSAEIFRLVKEGIGIAKRMAMTVLWVEFCFFLVFGTR
ncbi:hypothetical protein N7517_007243 [Penicillium concentricum]|uniref:Secreted protein n=1 Tax=Penicillium concentricum TaxID=293559 RepID=A0A9W9VAW6_9EURO|nr:uncharacterized protein N7517_007243 [Penicillium concentricum]KAJ5375237.1 hypothetical protein N7517_007243 [Penicillium concentricum]